MRKLNSILILLFALALQTAKAGIIECSTDAIVRRTFDCSTSSNNSFKVEGVTNSSLLDQALELVPSDAFLPLDKQKVDFNQYLNRLAFHHPIPTQGTWKLPELTLIAAKNKGIQIIQGVTIERIIEEARDIRWQDMKELFKYFRHEPNRHTGKFNAISNAVTYSSNDIRNRDVADVQQWALHEVFGVVGIDDNNYKISTLLILFIEGQISLAEFNKNQHFDLLHGTPILDPKRYNFPHLNEEGGVTGVEGGGDIVSASIKRHMIMARQFETGHRISQKEITEIMEYNIQYSSMNHIPRLAFNEEKIIDHPHIYTFFQDGQIFIILKENFRNHWVGLNTKEKTGFAEQIRDFIRVDFKQFNKDLFEDTRYREILR